jgi:hypothetical protein
MSDRGWRAIECDLVDFFRRRGDPLRDVCGRPFLATETFDEDTGQLLSVRHVVDLEELARALAEREVSL